MSQNIEVLGARVHNLKNIDLDIPKYKLVVITGISGSGKSSLAFDTIYAEGQRRYMESFGTYLRQFIGNLERPDVDKISGLSPVISIEQKTTNKNPRSTVGTVTEIYDFLRLLYAKVSTAYSYKSGRAMVQYNPNELYELIINKYSGKKISLLAPIVKGRKGHYRELFEQLSKQGFVKVRIDGVIQDLTPKLQVDRYKIHDIELVIDRLKVDAKDDIRIQNSIDRALDLGEGVLMIHDLESEGIETLSSHLMDVETGLSYTLPSPNTFSFNSPYGSCPSCKGLGTKHMIDMETIIVNKQLSIAQGSIVPIGEKREAGSWKIAEKFAKAHKIPINDPIEQLTDEQLNLMLYANKDGLITYNENDNIQYAYGTVYEGIINALYRYYNDTSSEYVRNWSESFMSIQECPTCHGSRLKQESLNFKIDKYNIAELASLPISALSQIFPDIIKTLSEPQKHIAKDIVKEVNDRIGFLLNVGLHYLTLNRNMKTLSGGESQRIRLATQIGSQLIGITYILDEPSIGLHQRDNARLIQALKDIRDLGNSVIVVEHDKDIMLASDYLIDMGPQAGIKGGEVIMHGTPEECLKYDSPTAHYLSGKIKMPIPKERRKGNGHNLELINAHGHNLKNVHLKIPLGTLTYITGVSGSGKSSLISETLYPLLSNHCYPQSKMKALPYGDILGLEHIDKVIDVDQSPIGRTPRSNPATYTGVFNDIRTLFAEVYEAKIRGYKPGRFSFNVKGGRCETCQGGGMKLIEMNFLPDVYVPCETCHGKRYNRETLEIRYKNKSISDILDMPIDEATEFFIHIPSIFRKIKTLQDVGLGYITLGQSAVTLSGGEAQRIKLATELSKKDTGKTVYILDEPSTGLHFQDIQLLNDVLNKLVEKGNTVIVIEHNLDLIMAADHIIDVGPEGGEEGGLIVAEGTPEKISKSKKSITGQFLKQELK